MQINCISRILSAVGLITVAAVSLATAAPPDKPPRRMVPQLVAGPQAVPADAVSPELPSELFTCQVGLAPFVCYDPFQMRTAYRIDKLIDAGFDGSGHTIVIIDAFQSPTLPSDLDTFNQVYGLPLLGSGFFTQFAPDGLGVASDPDDGQSWAGEISLDVEWAHAIAPGAKINLVLAKSDSQADILSAIKYAVDNNLGDVISMSFGANESCFDPVTLSKYHDAFAAATLKHITLFASSADEGAAQLTCNGRSWVKAVSHPASDPLVTGVGGTELHAANYCLAIFGCDPSKNPAPGTYAGEIVWNEFGSSSTGGGFSVLFDQPQYQEDALRNKSGRGVPDIAYNAALLHGVLVWFEGNPLLFGGTSAGAPQWAGITAIANQKAGERLGFLNSGIYKIGKEKKPFARSFHDITSGNNSVVEFDANHAPVAVTGFAAGTGWDADTGIGSPIDDGLVTNLIKFVSPDDGADAIEKLAPHRHGDSPNPGRMKPH
jgi:subtilase family serine protease